MDIFIFTPQIDLKETFVIHPPQIAQLDEPKIRISALRSVIDQLLLNGLEVVGQKCPRTPADDCGSCDGDAEKEKAGDGVKESDDEQDTIQSILLMFSEFLDSEVFHATMNCFCIRV